MKKCELCGGTVLLQNHHKYSQSKWARKLYGKLLDDPRNLMLVCGDCHASHRNPELPHWGELQFCEALQIVPRSKLFRPKVIG